MDGMDHVFGVEVSTFLLSQSGLILSSWGSKVDLEKPVWMWMLSGENPWKSCDPQQLRER